MQLYIGFPILRLLRAVRVALTRRRRGKGRPVAILAALLGAGVWSGCLPQTPGPAAEAGTLDLRSIDFAKQSQIVLQGEWDVVYDGEEGPREERLRLPAGAWRTTPLSRGGDPATGLVEYRLRVLLPEGAPKLILETGHAVSASRWTVNGRVLEIGYPAKSAAETRPVDRVDRMILPAGLPELDIRAEVANFHSAYGGLLEPPSLGAAQELLDAGGTRRVLVAALATAFFLAGTYHVLIYGLRRNRAAAYVSAICALLALRTTLVDVQIIHLLWPDLDYRLDLRLEYATINLISLFSMLMTAQIFPEDASRRLLRALAAVHAFFALSLVAPLVHATALLEYFLFLAGAVIAYCAGVALLASMRGRFSAGLFLFGVAIIAVGAGLESYQRIHSASPALYGTLGFLGFVFVQSFVISRRRFHSDLERYRLFVQNANDIVYSVDHRGRFTYASPNWKDVMGHEIEAIIGKPFELFVHPEDRQACRDFLQRVLEDGEKQSGLVYRVFHKSGEIRWHSSNASPMKDQDGTVVEYAGIARDVTDVMEVRNALDAARRRAEEASEAKSRFLASVSHELRNPFQAILSGQELVLESELPAAQRRDLEIAYRSTRALLDLLNQILDFTRIEAHKLTVEEIPMNLRRVAEDAAALYEKEARKKGLRLRLQMDPHLPERIRSDPIRLRQVLVNLISNAVKFTESGEVVLGVESAPPPAETPDATNAGSATEERPTEAPWRRYQISVRDTGPGIAPQAAEALFQPFSQADASMARRYGGAGLGLSLSNELVRLLNPAEDEARIEVRSAPGAGAEFIFPLRVRPAVFQPADPTPPQYEPTGERYALRVLYADDNEINRMVLTRMLQRFGCRTATAENGAEALELAQRERFDLVLTDLHMPVMNGAELARTLKAMPAYNRTPVVALSGVTEDHGFADFSAAGLDEYIEKPVDRDRLLRLLRQVSASL